MVGAALESRAPGKFPKQLWREKRSSIRPVLKPFSLQFHAISAGFHANCPKNCRQAIGLLGSAHGANGCQDLLFKGAFTRP